MKKIVSLLFCSLLCVTLLSCQNNNSSSSSTKTESMTEENKLMSVEEVLSTYSSSKLKCPEFSLSKYTEPYWTSQIIYNETVGFYEENGSVADKKLMYNPAKILEVRSYDLKTLYIEGTDYEMTESGIKWLTGSSIPTANFDYYYLDRPLDSQTPFRSIKYPDKYVAYNEFNYFIDKLICVTYIRTEEYTGPKQVYSEKLDNFVSKLENKENVTILFYGDSVMEGCNASGYRKQYPRMPKFSDMVGSKLYSYYGYADGDTTINFVNKAVGGWLSSTGIERWNEQIGDIVPDLMVIRFGTNDGTFSAPLEQVVNNHRIMIDRIKKANPDCAIILMSCDCVNDDAMTSENESVVRKFKNNQDEYEQGLMDLCEEYDDAVCIQMTSFYNWLLERKSFYDVIASGVSHPNDFYIRAYAQAILSKLIKEE